MGCSPTPITPRMTSDRLVVSTDANGVSVTNSDDLLGRLRTTLPDGGVESFGYSPPRLTAYTNQLRFTISLSMTKLAAKPSKPTLMAPPLTSPDRLPFCATIPLL